MNPVFAAVIVVVAIVLAGFAQLVETTFTRLSRARARGLDERRPDRATPLDSLVTQRERVVGPVALLRLAALIVVGALVGVVVSDRLGGWGGLAAVVVVIVVGELVSGAIPRRLGLEANDRMAVAMARPARILAAFLPLRWLAGSLARLARALVPLRKPVEHSDVGEDELIAMAEAAAEAAVIESAEAGLIESIIQLGDTVAREIMVPRPDMVALDGDLSVDDALARIVESGYSRLPVHGPGGVDDISGIVITKDLLKAILRAEHQRPIRELVRDAWFIPETKRVSELMREMQARKAHQAVVVDEYGATAGLITLEDIIEELVGEIADEYDEDRPLVERRADGSLVVSGRLPFDDFAALVGGEVTTDAEWDTVAGLLCDLLGHVPAEGESASWNGARLQAEKVHGRRIELVGVFPLDS